MNASFFRATSSQPLEAVQEIMNHFKKGGYELLFLDTAGRLHIDAQMLEELKEIDEVVNPRHKILVLDAMTGRNRWQLQKPLMKLLVFRGLC